MWSAPLILFQLFWTQCPLLSVCSLLPNLTSSRDQTGRCLLVPSKVGASLNLASSSTNISSLPQNFRTTLYSARDPTYLAPYQVAQRPPPMNTHLRPTIYHPASPCRPISHHDDIRPRINSMTTKTNLTATSTYRTVIATRNQRTTQSRLWRYLRLNLPLLPALDIISMCLHPLAHLGWWISHRFWTIARMLGLLHCFNFESVKISRYITISGCCWLVWM